MGKRLVINAGDSFHHWTILDEARQRGAIRYFKCQCKCGYENEIRLSGLLNGSSKSCGCTRKIPIKAGHKFNDWTVIEEVPQRGYVRYFTCRCICGTVKTNQLGNLNKGLTRNCGCVIAHGLARTPEYNSWISMRGRCNNPNNPHYDRYGERGIKVCREWDSFLTFLKDMGLRTDVKSTIERIDNSKGYSPDNCKWASRKTQARNKINTKLNSDIVARMRNEEITVQQGAVLADCALITAQQAKSGRTWQDLKGN